MKVIYKYPISLRRVKTEILLPSGFKYLDIQVQDGKLVLWALVDRDVESSQIVTLYTHGTGIPVEDESTVKTYLKTVRDGRFVWHIFGDLK